MFETQAAPHGVNDTGGHCKSRDRCDHRCQRQLGGKFAGNIGIGGHLAAIVIDTVVPIKLRISPGMLRNNSKWHIKIIRNLGEDDS